MINNKVIAITAASAAFAMPAFANTMVDSVADGTRTVARGTMDGTRAVARGTVNTGKKVMTGTADAGKSLLRAPGRMMNLSDGLLPNLSMGVQEFGVTGDLDISDDITYDIDLTYGYFFRDNWQVGFSTNVQGVESDVNVGLGIFTEYNWVFESKWVPFASLSADWAHLNSDFANSDSIALGVELGVKYFIRENIAISVSIGADYAFQDVFPGGDDFKQVFKIGTRYYF